MALVPFSYASPFYDAKLLPKRLFSFNGVDLTIYQELVQNGKGGTELGYGATVYECAFLLTDYLGKKQHVVKNRRVLELGCGVGLVSISSAIFGAKEVIASDGDAKSVRLCAKNCAVNKVSNVVNCQQIPWGEFELDVGDVDIILGADIVCFPYKASFVKLLETLEQVRLKSKSDKFEFILAYKPRRQRDEKVFFDLMEKCENFRLLKTIGPENLHQDFLQEGVILYHYYCCKD